MKNKLLMLILGLLPLRLLAQNPFEDIGIKVEVLTLSNGKYQEFFPNDTLRRVGSVMFNSVTGKIEYFVSEEQLRSEATAKPYLVSRWFSRDPLAAKYPSHSPYNFVANNPIIYLDPDGRDIVYFDQNGNEVKRVKTDKVFETYVATKLEEVMLIPLEEPLYVYVKAPMPNRILKTGKGDNHDYNKYDYDIAAQTYIFNWKKDNGELIPKTPLATDPASENVPDLDPNTVKAVALKETRLGKINGTIQNGKVDIMQVNVTGDWSKKKGLVGLEEKKSTSSQKQSISAGIMFLYWKGITVSTVKDSKGKITGWKTEWTGGKDWKNAVKRYNGGGDPSYMDKFGKHFEALEEGMTDQAKKQETKKQ